MADRTVRTGRIRLVFRRSRTLTKCVVLTTLLLCTVALLTLRGAITEANAQTETLRTQAAQLERRNGNLVQYISELDTVQGIARIAQEELGLAFPDTVVFKPE